MLRWRPSAWPCSRATARPWSACLLEVDGRLDNCAALLAGWQVIGVVPKTHLPNSNEFYEQRWFTSGVQAAGLVARSGVGNDRR